MAGRETIIGKSHFGYGVEVLGIKETVTALLRLRTGMVKTAFGKAVRAGAAPMVKIIKRTAPKRYGHLKRSIIQKVKRYPNGTIAAIVGPDYDYFVDGERPGKYIHLLELGTKPHKIPYPSKEEPRFMIQHPGTKALHWMRKAGEATREISLAKFTEKLRQATDIEIDKARAKGLPH